MSLGEKKCLVKKRMAVNTYSHSVPVLEAMKSEDLRTGLELLRIPAVRRRCAKNPHCAFQLLLGVWSPWGKQ